MLYVIINYANAGLQFLLLPFFVASVGQEGFGLFSFYLAILNWVVFLSTLGTQTLIRKSLLDNSKGHNKEHHKPLKFAIINSLIFNVIFLIYLLSQNGPISIVILAFSTTLFSLINAVQLGVGRLNQTAVFQLLAASGALSVFVLIDNLGFNLTYESRYTITSIFMLLLSLSFIFKFKDYFFPFEYQSEGRTYQLKENLKVASNSFFDKILFQGDKVVVGIAFGMKSLAIYALAWQFASILQILLKAIAVFGEQSLFKKKGGVAQPILLALVVGVVSSFALIVTLPSIIPILFGKEFISVTKVVPWLLILVIVRVSASLVFVDDLVEGNHLRNVLIQYCSLMVGILAFFVFREAFTLELFVQLLCFVVVVSLIANSIARVLTRE